MSAQYPRDGPRGREVVVTEERDPIGRSNGPLIAGIVAIVIILLIGYAVIAADGGPMGGYGAEEEVEEQEDDADLDIDVEFEGEGDSGEGDGEGDGY